MKYYPRTIVQRLVSISSNHDEFIGINWIDIVCIQNNIDSGLVHSFIYKTMNKKTRIAQAWSRPDQPTLKIARSKKENNFCCHKSKFLPKS